MQRRPFDRLFVCTFVLVLGIEGCGSRATVTPAAPPAPSAKAAVVAPRPILAPPGHILRSEVDPVLRRFGPGWLFHRRVLVEEVMRADGKFVGWRLTGLPEEWSGIDLLPGDVVTQVNGLPIQMPDDAWEVWKSVAKNPEIKVSVLRDGNPRKVVVPIDGPINDETVKALNSGAPQPSETRRAPRQGTTMPGATMPGLVEPGTNEVY